MQWSMFAWHVKRAPFRFFSLSLPEMVQISFISIPGPSADTDHNAHHDPQDAAHAEVDLLLHAVPAAQHHKHIHKDDDVAPNQHVNILT